MGQVAFQRLPVLPGQHLGRSHQHGLVLVGHRDQQRVDRYRRFAGPDVGLQKALHRHRARQIRVELADRLLLVRGQRERERLSIAQDQLSGLAERGRDRRLALAHAPRDPDLEQQQLVEREPAPRLLRLLEVAQVAAAKGQGQLEDEKLFVNEPSPRRQRRFHRPGNMNVADRCQHVQPAVAAA